MRISTLQPGLLVGLATRLTGNVKYTVNTIEQDRIEEGKRLAKWETTRVIEDAEEHANAVKARSKARSIITSVCTHSSFGLLCPESKQDILTTAIADAREVAERFNATAKLTRIAINVIAGRIAADDAEAVKAINSEVRGLLAQMDDGVRNLDAGKIREAASAAAGLGKMLNAASQERLQTAISAVRSVARSIVKAGETAAVEVDQSVLNRLAAVRSGFLDDDFADRQVELPTVGRALELEPQTQWPDMASFEAASARDVPQPAEDTFIPPNPFAKAAQDDDDGLPPIVTIDDIERARNLELE